MLNKLTHKYSDLLVQWQRNSEKCNGVFRFVLWPRQWEVNMTLQNSLRRNTQCDARVLKLSSFKAVSFKMRFYYWWTGTFIKFAMLCQQINLITYYSNNGKIFIKQWLFFASHSNRCCIKRIAMISVRFILHQQIRNFDQCQRNTSESKGYDVLHPVKVVSKVW